MEQNRDLNETKLDQIVEAFRNGFGTRLGSHWGCNGVVCIRDP